MGRALKTQLNLDRPSFSLVASSKVGMECVRYLKVEPTYSGAAVAAEQF